MANPEHPRKHQKSLVYVALLLFCLVLVILQLWLFVATLENLLAGRPAMALPAAIISAVILGVNIWMLVGLKHTERM
jgi:heme/copper-type cytochrome/quinol oxidase subunit 4